MPWLQAHTLAQRNTATTIEEIYRELGAISITFEDAADEALLEPNPGESPLWQATKVTALFTLGTHPETLRQRFNLLLPEGVNGEIRFELLGDQVWERVWLEDFQPMRFGRRLWVCPDGQSPPISGGVVIDLDPGLAFGTGTHPTTKLCLEWLDSNPPEGLCVMDFGCGSGILAIAALKLKAKRAIAVDHDPQALLATRENATKNGVLERLAIQAKWETPSDSADLVLANILAGTLIRLENQLAALVRPGGILVLSGILSEQAGEVASAFSTHFHVRPPISMNEWILIEAKRR